MRVSSGAGCLAADAQEAEDSASRGVILGRSAALHFFSFARATAQG